MFQILPLITKNRFWGLHIGKEFTHFFSHQEPADKKKKLMIHLCLRYTILVSPTHSGWDRF